MTISSVTQTKITFLYDTTHTIDRKKFPNELQIANNINYLHILENKQKNWHVSCFFIHVNFVKPSNFLNIRQLPFPLRRFGTVDEVARACVYLCSSDGDYITGSELKINGGLYM